MRGLMTEDATLRVAVEDAIALRRALRRLPGKPPGWSLALNLLRIPNRAGGTPRARPVTWAAAAACCAALIVVLLVRSPTEPATTDPRVAAVQDFELAMAVVQRSAGLTRSEVTEVVGSELQDALVTSRAALLTMNFETQVGDDNVD
jgi:hypothetical protein